MKNTLAVLSFGLFSLFAFCQQSTAIPCEVSRAFLKGTVEPSGKFYVQGTGYLVTSGEKNALVAGAFEFEKYLAIEIRIFNETEDYITVHPEQICAQDLIDFKVLPVIPASEVSKKIRHVSLWQAFAQGAAQAGEMYAQEGSSAVQSDTTGNFSYRSFDGAAGTGTFDARTTSIISTCEAGCQERKKAIAQKYMRADVLREQRAATVEGTALMTHTIAPHTVYSGIVYIAKPKMAVLKHINESRKKTFMVNLVLPFGGERFMFFFPIDAPN